jgi:fructose-bisphosphate aldolase class II/tagatose 1,6-diphosphate aldolase GatY/KbaY
MNLQTKLLELSKKKEAILAANFYNLETLNAIISAAKAMKAPIVLQLSESSINYIGLELAAQMAKIALQVSGVEGWLHLDHGGSIDLVQRCLDAGFDSVMIDASEKPMEENISISKEIVKRAEKYGVSVEAELGYIAKLHQDQDHSGFTQPEDARYFTEQTGVNALAVSIGSAHGFYKQEPKLDLQLLSAIKAAVNTPLVLHGASGIPDEMLVNAIKKGITKINLATETKNAFMRRLKEELTQTDEIDLRIVFPRAIEKTQELIQNKLKVISHLTYTT